jgi:putative heme-binding domain-containing protein
MGLVRALPLWQAPNQAQLVTHSVAGVKFSTLPGFVIERVNPAEKNDSYVVLTFDSLGRPVVSKENDHPRLLIDNDKDGIFESEKVITDKVRNCQGLWFDGPTLYGSCSDAAPQPPPPAAPAAPGGGRQGGGRGGPPPPAGVYRMQDTNGDDVADTFATVAITPGGIQEHGPHAIRRAPDGGYTVIAGNHATITDEKLDPGSLVLKDKDAQLLPYLPNFGRSIRQAVHSGIYRWDPTIEKFSVLFGGNRNAYDYAYNLAGEVFLFDSDMEWDINMPWYREVRTVHGIPGANFGYRDGSGKYPAYYVDSLPPVRDVGRGSPVGVEFYTSYAYPREFFDNLFEADWSRGRLLYTALTPNGATYSARSDRAEFVHGEPFNITDVEVGPDGMLYFTTGGRNTSGGVWRLRYTGTPPASPDMTGILAVVRQPQPLSSWGWAAIEKVKTSKGPAFGAELERLARNTGAASLDRVRAIHEMQRHGAPPSANLLGALSKDRDAALRAAVVYVAGAQGGLARAEAKPLAAIAAAGLKDADPVVRRRSAEALVRMGHSPDKPGLAPVADIYALLNDPDRFVRWAGRIALERTPRADWRDRAAKETNVLGAIEGMLALVNTAPAGESLQPLIDKQFAMMKQPNLSVENSLRLFRALQYTITEIKGGLSPAQREQLHGLIVDQFPAQDERLNRELALMLAYAGQPQAIAKILSAMPEGDENQPLQLHYLYALRTVAQGWTPDQKAQLAELLGRTSTWRGGAQFINFVGQMFEAVQPLFASPEEQQLLYEKAPDFSPLTPEQIAEIQARQAQTGRGGGRGNISNPLAARRAGRVISRQEMLEEMVFQPQQNLNVEAGRGVFEKSCASCHRFGSLGTDHGIAGLNLTSSTLLGTKYTLLEAVVIPDRVVAPAHETTVVTTTDGRTIRGLAIRDDASNVSLLTPEGTVTDVPRAQIKASRREKTSIMTETLADSLGQNQLRNLAAFLTGPPPAPPAGGNR